MGRGYLLEGAPCVWSLFPPPAQGQLCCSRKRTVITQPVHCAFDPQSDLSPGRVLAARQQLLDGSPRRAQMACLEACLSLPSSPLPAAQPAASSGYSLVAQGQQQGGCACWPAPLAASC